MKNILLIIVNIFIAVLGFAQPYYFRHYEVESGLSNNTVISIIQDQYGFMWFGTSDGLNKFDGTSFKIYRNNSEPNSVGSNSIYALHEDQNGTIWIGTEKGLYYYNRQQDNFSIPANLPRERVRAICSGTKDSICFIIKNELFLYNTASKKLVRTVVPSVQEITSLYVNPNTKNIWIGTSDGRIGVLQNKKIILYNVSEKKLNSIEAIAGYDKNHLLIGSSTEGLKKINTETKQVETIIGKRNTGKDLFVRGILRNSDSSYFITTEDGLYQCNIARNSFERISKQWSDPYALSDNALYGMYKDKEGGVWIGSYFGGINYLPKSTILFEKYFPGNLQHSLSGSAIREIVKDHNNNLWIGSEDGGLTRYNEMRNQFTKFFPNSDNGLSSFNLHGLLALNNKLLIGTFEHGLDIMDLRTEKVIRHFSATDSNTNLKSNFITKIFKTSRNNILVCTATSLYSFDIDKGIFTPKNNFPKNTFYSAVFEDRMGTVWIGTHNQGLFTLKNNIAANYELPINGVDVLKSTRIVYIMEDRFQQLWVCTINGLYCINLKTHTYKLYNTSKGLPGNIVYSIVQDDLNNYWIATSGGLVNLNNKNQHIKVFTVANGLLNDQFNFQSAYKDAEGNIYFGSIKGIVRFNPKSFQTDNYIPPIYFTNIHFADSTTPTEVDQHSGQALMFVHHLKLPYNQSTFSIEFAALCFAAPANISYEYKINNSQWYNSGTNRKIFFTNLSPGKHTITVRSTNGSGNSVNNNKTLEIEILPPFWRTDLAYFIYFLLFTLAVVLVVAFYLNRQRQKQQYEMELFALEKEKELYKAKMDFYTNVTHEIKTPLTLIKLPLEQITNALMDMPHLKRYLQILNKNTERLMELTHQLLDFRKMETAHYILYPTDIDLADFTTTIITSFSTVIEQRKIDLQIGSIKENTLISADKEALTKIINNLIENAIKYSNHKINISIEATQQEDFVILKVENDGKTIPEIVRNHIFEPFFRYNHDGIAGSGIGLSLVHSLVQLHQGRIAYSVENDMNVFTVTFPIHKQFEKNNTTRPDGTAQKNYSDS